MCKIFIEKTLTHHFAGGFIFIFEPIFLFTDNQMVGYIFKMFVILNLNKVLRERKIRKFEYSGIISGNIFV